MEIIVGRNLEALAKNLAVPGVFGVVTNVRFVRCCWPALDEPVALFADGSGGIEVQGPPTPRNVVFPPDTVFLGLAVNDGRWNKPSWRTSEIVMAPSYFIRTRHMADVVEEIERIETIDMNGRLRTVKYMDEQVVQREVEHIEHLTVDEARAYIARR